MAGTREDFQILNLSSAYLQNLEIGGKSRKMTCLEREHRGGRRQERWRGEWRRGQALLLVLAFLAWEPGPRSRRARTCSPAAFQPSLTFIVPVGAGGRRAGQIMERLGSPGRAASLR